MSAHEGQVALVAKLPGVGGFDRAKIEDIIVDLLSVDGAVYAYQKQLATETGTFRMIAEFCDVGSAHRAVARLNGAVVRVSASGVVERHSLSYRREYLSTLDSTSRTLTRDHPATRKFLSIHQSEDVKIITI